MLFFQHIIMKRKRGFCPSSRTLFQAVKECNVLAVRNAVTIADVNRTNDNGLTVLILAARYGHMCILRILLNCPSIDVNIQAADGDTALMRAIYYHNTECVNALLRHPTIKVNIQTYSGVSAIMLASQRGHIDYVRLLLKKPNIDIHLKDDRDRTALQKTLSSLWGFYSTKDVFYCALALFEKYPHYSNSLRRLLPFAAKFNHVACLKTLLTFPKINVNYKKIRQGCSFFSSKKKPRGKYSPSFKTS